MRFTVRHDFAQRAVHSLALMCALLDPQFLDRGFSSIEVAEYVRRKQRIRIAGPIGEDGIFKKAQLGRRLGMVVEGSEGIR